MKTKFYLITILAFFILFQGIDAQNQFKKVVKLKPPPTQSKLVSTPQHNADQIAQKIKEIIKNKGLVNFQNKASSFTTSNSSLSKFKINYLSTTQNLNNREVYYDEESGLPIFLKTNSQLKKQSELASKEDLIKNAKAFLIKEKDFIRSKDPDKEFELKNEFKDELGLTHIKFTQKYDGLEVWGKEVIVHMDKSGNVMSMNGRFVPTPNLVNINENISSNEAVNIAIARSGVSVRKFSQEIKELLNYDGPVARKIIWCDALLIPHLAWFVEVRDGIVQDWYYFIDAKNGSVLNYYNNICYDGKTTGTGTDLNGESRTFGVYQVGSDYLMVDASQPMFDQANSQIPDKIAGALVTLSLNNKDLSNENPIYFVTSNDNTWTDPAAVSAHFNGIRTYKFFNDTFNRNSIDNKGMTIYSIVHATENNQPMDNAFWSGQFMCYGDGNIAFKPLAGGYDVTVHEMTHGVTQYSAALEYQGQSGALNESNSDCLAATADDVNWTMAEQIVKNFSLFPTGAMRDLSNPHNGGTPGSACWQPANMSEFVNTTEDNGGVHINSGIPNHAFYLVATTIGRGEAAQIWYRTLTVYLTRNSQFIDARIATINAASDLFGATSNQVNAVKSAWDAVGVTEGSGTTPPPSSSIVGDNWILMTNTYSYDQNSLYMAPPVITSQDDFLPLSTTPVGNRPAVSDASGLVIFIDQDHNLRALTADPNNPGEQVLDNSGVWWSVAIGPGLSSLALTSIYADTTIYYYDLVNSTSASFKIVTQSFDGPDAKTALYADALSFDPTGQFLLFDSYNEVKNADGSNLSFWTINILDINSGQMGTVFPPMGEGIDIGNPSFSKTSSIHFTFDYFDENANEDYVMAADFNTGAAGLIYGPIGVIGYPTYSGDDKTIAYHTTTYYQSSLWDAINQMSLKDNMIEGTGTPQDYVIAATYPYWFVIGTRISGVDEKDSNIPTSFYLSQNYPNPFNPSTTISYKIPKSGIVTLKVFDVLGNEVTTLVDEYRTAGQYSVQFTVNNEKLSSGIYFYQLKASDFIQTKKMILLK